jgi:hypothetical protein
MERGGDLQLVIDAGDLAARVDPVRLAVAFAGGCAWVDDRLAELPGGAALRSVGAGLLAAALACFFLGFAA